MLTIRIKGLLMRAHHGVMDQERLVGNDFRVDIDLRCAPSLGQSIETDNLNSTVNYAEVIELVKREMAKPSKLLEHVVWRISKAISREFPSVEGGRVELTKLMPPCGVKITEGVSAEISWSR